MEYMLLICSDPAAPAYVAAEDNIEEWVAKTEARGASRHGDRLRPAEDAITVTVRDGEVRRAPGPFVETDARLLGYDVIECATVDEAVEIAAEHPMARFGQIEVRPVWPLGL